MAQFSRIIYAMIEPIDESQKAQVVALTGDYIGLARHIFRRRFAPVDVNFDLIGSSSGMFRVSGRHCEIRYNPWIFAKYYDESLESTVPHEVAHYIVHRLYGLGRVAAHGEEWRSIMAAFGADASVTSNHDLSGIPHRRQRRWLYHCACQEHRISTTRHNRITRGRDSYLCRSCGGELKQVRV